MRVCGRTLANFHKTGLVSSLRESRMNMLGKWYAELRMKHETLFRHISLSKQTSHPNRLDLFLRKHGDEILSYSSKAQSILGKSGYRLECKEAERQPHICHGDGGPTNFIFNDNGSYLIDFETLRVDLRAYDLYRIIYNSCKDHEWNFTIARAILDGYQVESKLNAADVELTKVWLRFPRTVVLLLNKYHRLKSLKIKSDI